MNTETQFLPAANPRVLQSFSRALGRESHVLSREPDLLWQQMYNRLQWEGEAKQLLNPELMQRCSLVAKPWLRLDTPFSESPFLVRTLEGHHYGISACAISKNNRWIASIDCELFLILWEASTGQILWMQKKLDGDDEFISCGFLLDGRLTYAASGNMKIQVWETTTGRLLHTLALQKVPFGMITCICSPDGGFWISAGEDKNIRIWENSTNQLLKVLEGHLAGVFTCDISPDGDRIVSAGRDCTIRIWDVSTGQPIFRLKGHTSGVSSCKFSPDGHLIVSASYDKSLRVWDSSSGQLLQILQGHTEMVSECSFSPDGLFILSASADRSLRIWEAETGRLLLILQGHPDDINACSFSPDGTLIVSGSSDGSIKVWRPRIDSSVNPPIEEDLPHESGISNPFPDNDHPIPANHIGLHTNRDSFLAPDQCKLSGHNGWVLDCNYSTDGKRIASIGIDGNIILRDAKTSEILQIISGSSHVKACSISPDGQWIISGGPDMSFQVINIESRVIRCNLEGYCGGIESYKFSPNGKYIVSGCSDRNIRIWEADSGKHLRTIEGHTATVSACGFSPDGERIVSASPDHTLRIWDPFSGELIHCLDGRTIFLDNCAYSPDGNWIVAGGALSLQVWMTKTGALVSSNKFPIGRIMACDFLPDGDSLISISDKGILWVSEPLSGRARGSLRIPGNATAMAIHPIYPYLLYGDDLGYLNRVTLIAFNPGPIIVTVVETESSKFVTCPACQTHHPITQSQLGSELTCPTPGCGLHLKINPFVIHMA